MGNGLTNFFGKKNRDKKSIAVLENKVVFLLLVVSAIASLFLGYHRASQGVSTTANDQFIDSIINGYTSSAILLLVFGVLQEINSRKAIQDEMIEQIEEKIESQFHIHYKLSTPLKVYEHSQAPTDAFRKNFVDYCSKSKTYITRGVGGDFTVFRIKENIDHNYIKHKETITLHLLDPREDGLLQQRAFIERGLDDGNSHEIQNIVDDLKEEIFCTIYWLYAFRNKQKSKVILHKDTPFYRAEFFDDAVFLSFYLGGEYPGTLLFEKDSFIYIAFEKCLTMSANNSSLESMQMSAGITQMEFEDFIKNKLKCHMSFEELKQKAENRMTNIAKKMKKNNFSTESPF